MCALTETQHFVFEYFTEYKKVNSPIRDQAWANYLIAKKNLNNLTFVSVFRYRIG